MFETTIPFAEKRPLRGVLVNIRRSIHAESATLASLPATWQVLAHALEWKDAPWSSPLPKSLKPWIPGFRPGFNRKSARAKLVALSEAKAAATPDTPNTFLRDGAAFLTEQFTGDALTRLRDSAQAIYEVASRRNAEDWWRRLPIPTPPPRTPTAFSEEPMSRGAASSYANMSNKFVAPIFTELSKSLDMFCEAQPNRVFDSGNPAARTASPSGQFFTISGLIKLTPEESAALRNRAVIIAARLVTAVSFAQQDDVDAVLKHVHKNLLDEIRHDAHAFFGKKQIALMGDMIVADFPLAYWRSLARDAKPTEDLPYGRRMDFTPSESGAIYEALNAINRRWLGPIGQKLALTSTQQSARVGLVRTEGAGLLFNHLNALGLVAWVEALPVLLKKGELTPYLGNKTLAEAELLIAGFLNAAKEIINIRNLILARNHGLASSLHQRFIGNNASFQGHDSRDVASLIQEEMIKTIGSFNFLTGLRFSTYLTMRVSLELRRKPYADRQLIKLSPELTTAQPRIYQLALESEFDEDSAEFLPDLAERYNIKFGTTARLKMTAAAAGDLLYVGQQKSLMVQDEDGTERENSGIDHDWIKSSSESHTDDALLDAAREVRHVLDRYSPAEELVLSILLQSSPPPLALRRFNRAYMDKSLDTIGRVINMAAKEQAKKNPADPLTHIEYRTQWGQSERAIRTRQSDEPVVPTVAEEEDAE